MIYIVTETVLPLDDKIEELREYPNSISWGIYEVAVSIYYYIIYYIIHSIVKVISNFCFNYFLESIEFY